MSKWPTTNVLEPMKGSGLRGLSPSEWPVHLILIGLLPSSRADVSSATCKVGNLYLRFSLVTCSSVLTFDCAGVRGPDPKRAISKPIKDSHFEND